MSNARILGQIAEGNEEAFADYYRCYRSKLIGYAVSILAGDISAAEDAVDDAFLDLWRNAANISQKDNDEAWMRKIVHNKSVDWLRKYGGQKIDIQSMPNKFELNDDYLDEKMESIICDRLWLSNMFIKLSLDQRAALQLFYYEELSIVEIAQIMDCPVNTVKSRLYHARKIIQSQYALTVEKSH